MPDKDIDKIEPVEFDAGNSPALNAAPAVTREARPSIWLWLGLGGLVVVALAVIFVLPALVSEYELPLERRVQVAAPPSTPATSSRPAANSVSPFTEAQRAIQRKAAQDVLAELLESQAELDDRGVSSWGQESYQAALSLAQLGDEAYLEQDFIGARDRYEEGLEGLQNLLARIPQVLAQQLTAGEAALEAGDSALALEKFTIALQLDPESEPAMIGLERAGTLDEVNGILAQADQQRAAGQLEDALGLYRSALNLDPLNRTARELSEQVDRQLLENRFARVMSEGFNLLQNDQPQRAIEAFQRAAALGINRNQAEAAIQQTRDEVARVEIERLRAEATTAENAEQWQQAVTAYQSVLEIDANLLFAQRGLDYASKRLRLDQLLQGAIANPDRFADNEVYQQTLDVYFTGRAIENPGSRLLDQLDRLQALLENSQVPVSVSFVSDDATQVTLLRHAELGTFESTTLDLKPGRYVAVGIREGYRDVRQEFMVGFGQTPEAVVVRCDEPIVASRGR